MADITSLVTITGSHEDAIRPLSWHMWGLDIPGSAIPAGTHHVVLPDRFHPDTRLMGAKAQTAVPITGGISQIGDLEHGFMLAGQTSSADFTANGAITDLVTGLDLGVEDTVEGVANSNWSDFGTAIAALSALRLEIVATGTADAAALARIYVAVLIGRTEY